MSTTTLSPALGVCIVTYNAADVITGCLATLFSAESVRLRVVVVDNASTDDTVARIRNWASGTIPSDLPPDMPFILQQLSDPIKLHEADPGAPLTNDAKLTILHASVNGGFAAGVNLGIAYLVQDMEIDRFWILNPDCVVPTGTPIAFASHPAPSGGFALMGGRVNYLSPRGYIQSDGGYINRWTAATINVNRGRAAAHTQPPMAGSLDFISGASMVASRTFLDQAGPLDEDYFLYYEEVDWALRRGALPLLFCDGASVYHHAGSAIGSGNLERSSTAFSVYFLYRARMRFVRRHFPLSFPVAYLYALARAFQHVLKRQWIQLHALLCGIHGLRPPFKVRVRLSPEAAHIAFGSQSGGRKRDPKMRVK